MSGVRGGHGLKRKENKNWKCTACSIGEEKRGKGGKELVEIRTLYTGSGEWGGPIPSIKRRKKVLNG